MTRRRRLMLRGAMYACIVLGSLASVGWLLSGWYTFLFVHVLPPRYFGVSLNGGSLQVSSINTPSLASAPVRRYIKVESATNHDWQGRFDYHSDNEFFGGCVPLWLLSLGFLAPAYLCFRLSRRPIPGLCPRCGYDVSASPAGPCPECGQSPDVLR